MGIFRQFPYSNFHEMNMDWILKQIRILEEKWDKFVFDWKTNLREEVDKWLTEHPEYMTTVEDNSITSIKLHSEAIPFYNVNDFDILPGDQDNYEKIHNLFKDKVYYTGGIVYFPKGKYIVSDTIFIPENTTLIGDGAETEIYFDESYTYFGTGLSNAGSNVTIKNIKATQKSKGVFHGGAQPGCIGFSNNHREMAIQSLHTTVVLRSPVHNLKAVDIYTDDSFYVLQTENDSSSEITNVIYENIHAPRSCVSVMASSAGIRNVKITNIEADTFRITWPAADGGIYENVIAENITCQTPIFNSRNSEAVIIVNNLVQTTESRKNDLRNAIYSAVIDGNVEFNNCFFNAIADETDGIALFYGVRTFNNCRFNATNKVMSRMLGIMADTNYEILHHCILNAPISGSQSAILGYGYQNTFIGNYNNMIWGDVHRIKTAGKIVATIAAVTGRVPSVLKIDNDSIILQCYVTITNTNNILTLNALGLSLLNTDSNNQIPVILFNSSAPESYVHTFAVFDSNGVLKVDEGAYENSTAYNRVKISAQLETKTTPDNNSVFNLLS